MRKVLSILLLFTFTCSVYAQDVFYGPFFPDASPTVKAIVLDQQDCFEGKNKNYSLFTVKVIDDFDQELPDTMVLAYPMPYYCQDREYWEFILDCGRINIDYHIEQGKKYYFTFHKIRTRYEIGRFFEIKFGRTYCSKGGGYFTEQKEKLHVRGMSTVRFEHLLKKGLTEEYNQQENLKQLGLYNIENGFVFVDLGLSVKWAEYNVGADKPEDYGDYFAWGETGDEKKDEYWWTNYKYCNGTPISLTKYCYDSRYGLNGFADNKSALDPDDDVAHVIWGGKWRMPTVDEFNELIDSCTWTWTNRNGVNGYIVTSNMPGYTDRSIFLPACGYYWYSELNRADSASFYWSGSLDDHWPYDASILFFEENRHITFVDDRYSGIPVRPVCPK